MRRRVAQQPRERFKRTRHRGAHRSPPVPCALEVEAAHRREAREAVAAVTLTGPATTQAAGVPRMVGAARESEAQRPPHAGKAQQQARDQRLRRKQSRPATACASPPRRNQRRDAARARAICREAHGGFRRPARPSRFRGRRPGARPPARRTAARARPSRIQTGTNPELLPTRDGGGGAAVADAKNSSASTPCTIQVRGGARRIGPSCP